MSDKYYYRARYLDPTTGRFLSEDPIGFKGTDTNLYRYVRNQSIIHTDPTGKITSLMPILIGGFVTYLIGDILDGLHNEDSLFQNLPQPIDAIEKTDQIENQYYENKKFKKSEDNKLKHDLNEDLDMPGECPRIVV